MHIAVVCLLAHLSARVSNRKANTEHKLRKHWNTTTSPNYPHMSIGKVWIYRLLLVVFVFFFGSATLQMLVVALVHSRLDYGNGVLVGLPAHLMRRLQSVLNAAARLIYRLKTRDHITDALISLHWLRVPERIQYKLATLAYRALYGDAPRYLGPLIRVDDLPGRRPLRSANTNRLVVPQVKLSTVGNRAFAAAAPSIWERLPTDVIAANLLFVDCSNLFSSRQSYLDVVYWLHPISGPRMAFFCTYYEK